MKFSKILDYRQTCKKYNDKKISEKDWNTIKEAILWSPTSMGLEHYRVINIDKSSPLRQQLLPLMWKQGPVVEADKLIFFITLNSKHWHSETKWLKDRLMRAPKIFKGLSDEEAEKIAMASLPGTVKNLKTKDDNWGEKQAYIGLGFVLLTAAMLKIDSTPMEGFMPKEVTELFLKNNIINSDELVTVCAALGYRDSDTAFANMGNGKRIRESIEYKVKEVK